MKDFADLRADDRRLSILLILEKSEGYEANLYVLQDILDGHYGHRCSVDRVRADLAWLQEQGLATRSNPGGVEISRATARGIDAANGRAEVPGVKRPRPE